MNQKLKRQNFNSNINNKNSKDHRPENNYNRNKDISKSQNILKLSSNQTIISGKHSTLSALGNRNRHLFYLITTQDNKLFWENEIKEIGVNIEITIRKKEELDAINNHKPHQNIILITKPLERISLDEFLNLMKLSNSSFSLSLSFWSLLFLFSIISTLSFSC